MCPYAAIAGTETASMPLTIAPLAPGTILATGWYYSYFTLSFVGDVKSATDSTDLYFSSLEGRASTLPRHHNNWCGRLDSWFEANNPRVLFHAMPTKLVVKVPPLTATKPA